MHPALVLALIPLLTAPKAAPGPETPSPRPGPAALSTAAPQGPLPAAARPEPSPAPGEKHAEEEPDQVPDVPAKLSERPIPAADPETVTSMTFGEVLAKALGRNRDLARAGLDLAQAREKEKEARAKYDTTLSSGVKYQSSRTTPVEGINIQNLRSSTLEIFLGASQPLPTGGAVSLGYSTIRSASLMRFSFADTPIENDTTYWDANLSLSVTHPLLRGVGTDTNLAALRQARHARQAAAWSAKARAEAVVRDLWKAFLDVLAAEGGARVQAEALSQANRDLVRAKALETAGRLPPADLVDYRFAVAVHERALLEARTTWLSQSLALRLLTGEKVRPGHGLISAKLPEDPFTAALPTEAEAARAALGHSRELLMALEELEIKKIGVLALKRDHWPSLDASAAVGPIGRSNTIGGAHESLFRFKSIGWSVGLTMSYLVGHRGAKAAREQAALEVRRQEVALDEVRQTLVAAATRAVALLALEKRLASTSAKEHALALLRLENERKRFAVGRSSLFVLLQLQQDVTAAAHRALTARLACLKRWAELEALTGALLARFGLREDRL